MQRGEATLFSPSQSVCHALAPGWTMSETWSALYCLYSSAFSLSPRITAPIATAAHASRQARLVVWWRVLCSPELQARSPR